MKVKNSMTPPRPKLDLTGERFVNWKMPKEVVHNAKILAQKDGETLNGLALRLLENHVDANKHRL